ncbi:MAG: C-terminal binding protein, partial [Dehalococcoidia bacterium]|nr:C-terminal binding protein [Dehalococcoidia bacterium]
MSFKVLLPLAVGGESDKYPQRFRELGAEFLQRDCAADDQFISAARDVDAIITVGSIRSVPRSVIENLEHCRIVCNTQIGYDSIDVEAATERGILVTNVPGYCTEEVSDHAMALLLACARRIVQLNDAARRGQWGLSADATEVQSRIWPGLSRLRGQTLGLLGLGRVGRAVASKARGFGLRVIACDPYVPEDIASQVGVELVDQERLFRESDFLSIHAALTPETRHIMDARAFREMKPSACLINTARGGFVDETALCQALREGKIAMAALDVTETEPPGPQ